MNILNPQKKSEKNAVKNYRPISLLPVCSKIMERLIFNSLHSFLHSNSLLSVNQSGFRPNDSCTNQLSAIVHEIMKSFDSSNPTPDVRGVFLDISKAFDRVWHDGLIYDLRCYGIQGKVLDIIQSFLKDRYQRVVLDG